MSCLSSLFFFFLVCFFVGFCLFVFSFLVGWGFFCLVGFGFGGFFCYRYYKNSEIQTLRSGCYPHALMLLVLQIHCGKVASVFTQSEHQKCSIFSEQKNDDQYCWIPPMKNHIPSLALNSWKLKTDRWTQDTTARLLGSQTNKPHRRETAVKALESNN